MYSIASNYIIFTKKVLLWLYLIWLLAQKQANVRDGTYVRPSHNVTISSYIAKKYVRPSQFVRPSQEKSPITLELLAFHLCNFISGQLDPNVNRQGRLDQNLLKDISNKKLFSNTHVRDGQKSLFLSSSTCLRQAEHIY